MSRFTIVLGSIFLALILAYASPVWAKPPHGGNQGNQSNQWNNTSDNLLNRAGANAVDRLSDNLLPNSGISQSSARSIARDLGLTGYQNLPPGIQKNLLRGKPLPPGIARKVVPNSMLSRLPNHPGYEWRMAGVDLVLVAINSGLVSDVLRDVFK